MHVNPAEGGVSGSPQFYHQGVEVSPVSVVTLIITELLQGLCECRTCYRILTLPAFVSHKKNTLILIFVCFLMWKNTRKPMVSKDLISFVAASNQLKEK